MKSLTILHRLNGIKTIGILILIVLLIHFCAMAQEVSNLHTKPFDKGWHFKKVNLSSESEKIGFDVLVGVKLIYRTTET
ncbi:MAG: hypothetical protein JKX79_00030 [Labilibaculum sp.]|nr:hypothetical protein [Labilibaculum sp.]